MHATRFDNCLVVIRSELMYTLLYYSALLMIDIKNHPVPKCWGYRNEMLGGITFQMGLNCVN